MARLAISLIRMPRLGTALLFRPLNFLMMLVMLGPWMAPYLMHAADHGETLIHIGMRQSAYLTYAIGWWICPEHNLSWSLFNYPFIVCVRCTSAGLGLFSAAGFYATQFRWGHSLPFSVYRRISPALLLLLILPWMFDAWSQLSGISSGSVELRVLTAWLGGLGIGMYVYGLLFGEPAQLKAKLRE